MLASTRLRSKDGGARATSDGLRAPASPQRTTLHSTTTAVAELLAVAMAPQLPPPDEQEYDAPQMLGTLPDGQLDLYNNPFWYFTNSPWFDPSSQNISLFMSCQRMPNGQQVMNDRKLWHERLHEQGQGSRFVIVGEPQAEGQPWVIQRQNKTENEDGETETLVEGNWYFQGTKILMAPSVYDVVQSRLVSGIRPRRIESSLTLLTAIHLYAHATDCRTVQENDTLVTVHWLLRLSSLVRRKSNKHGQSHRQSNSRTHRSRCHGIASASCCSGRSSDRTSYSVD